MIGRISQPLPNTSQKFMASAEMIMLHEHHGMKILQDYKIKVPPFGVAQDAETAFNEAERIGGKDFVVKAQVLARGREKGIFSTGILGLFQLASSFDEVKQKARRMIGANFTSHQNKYYEEKCKEVMVCKRLFTRREYYFSITFDRNTNGPIVIASSQGGVNIEKVAATNPEAIVKMPIDIKIGITKELAHEIAVKMGFSKDCEDQASETIEKLYKIFKKSDAILVEINPMGEDVNGSVHCFGCNILLDANSELNKHNFSIITRNEHMVEPETSGQMTENKTYYNDLKLRQKAGLFIHQCVLTLTENKGNTRHTCSAITLFNRCCEHLIDESTDELLLAAACLYVCENDNDKPHDLIKIANIFWNYKSLYFKEFPTHDVTQETCYKIAQKKVEVIEFFENDTRVLLPHPYVLDIMKIIEQGTSEHKALTKQAYFLASEVLHITNWTTKYSCQQIAVASVMISAFFYQAGMEDIVFESCIQSVRGVMPRKELIGMCCEFLAIYSESPQLRIGTLKHIDRHGKMNASPSFRTLDSTSAETSLRMSYK